MAPTLADLVGAMDALAGPWYSVEVGVPSGAEWMSGDRWVDDGGALVADQLAEIAEARTGGRDVAAMFAAGAYARAAVVPLVGAYRAAGVALELTPERLRVHVASGGWFDRFAIHPDTPVVGNGRGDDGEEVRAAVGHALRSTLSPYLATIRSQVPIGLRGLWATVGDTVAATLLTARDRFGGTMAEVVEETALLLDCLAPEVRSRPTFRVVTVPGSTPRGQEVVQLQLSVCCLAYKGDNGVYCGGCPLLAPSRGSSPFGR